MVDGRRAADPLLLERLAAVVASLGFLASVVLGCAPGAERPGALSETEPPFLGFKETDSPALASLPEIAGLPAFDVIAGDMDLDGDPDVFVNRHLHRPELWMNRAGHLEIVNAARRDKSGLFDNRGIPDLFAESAPMLERIRAEGLTGLYLWHDPNPFGSWRFYLHSLDALEAVGAILSLRFNTPVAAVNGLSADELERLDAFDLRVKLKPSLADRMFAVRTDLSACQLKIELTAGDTTSPLPPLRVGPDWTPVTSSKITLWKRDPHGVAWLQALGSPEPDLLLVRGGLRGTLLPPHDPKVSPFFVWDGRPDGLYSPVADGTLPPDYGRGRQVEWVDLDNDGVHELYIGNHQSPNSLLVWDRGSERFVDRASEAGLAFLCGESFAWLDWSGDGLEDLVFVCGGRLSAAKNDGGLRFEIVDAKGMGLVLPEVAEPEKGSYGLLLLDFDNDGALDLWVSGHGTSRANFLFRGKGDRFVNVTEEVGLAGFGDTHRLLRLDVDNDSYVDAVSVGPTAVVLLENEKGRRFRAKRLGGLDPEDRMTRAGASYDGDFDGRVDLFIVGHRRYALRNESSSENGFLRVQLGGSSREPIGALVRVHYRDGRTQVQRYGSASNSGVSQVLQPLHFGAPKDNPVEAIRVRWPGADGEMLLRAPSGNATLEIRRSWTRRQ